MTIVPSSFFGTGENCDTVLLDSEPSSSESLRSSCTDGVFGRAASARFASAHELEKPDIRTREALFFFFKP